MNAPATTPTTENKDSALATFIKSLDPKVKPNKSDKSAAATIFKAFQAKKQAALKVLKDLEAEEGEVARSTVKAFGKDHLTVGGVTYAPTSRDERIYYKELSGKAVEI